MSNQYSKLDYSFINKLFTGELRRHDKTRDRADKLLSNAYNEIVAFERALKEYVTQVDPAYGKQTDEFFIGFEGSFGRKHVTPRTLTSSDLNSTVCVEGIVTKASLVRPKLVTSVHYCPSRNRLKINHQPYEKRQFPGVNLNGAGF